ncbi:MAG TPA: hypothetical protein VFJ43_11025, partial [Bacteroidia bacterium]|nr:hypothetical protein [Bacteroidia bacterium]
MAICKLSTPVTKGTKLSIDINYFPVRKRFSPGIVLKKGKDNTEENNVKKDLFNKIVNEWEWLLLNASPEEVLKVYDLKAGEKTRNLYKSISIKDVLNQIRGNLEKNDHNVLINESDVPASV